MINNILKGLKFNQIELKFAEDGKKIKVKRFKEGHIPEISEFDFAVLDFGDIFQPFRGRVVPDDERIKNSQADIKVWSYKNKNLEKHLRNVTEYANMPGKAYENTRNRLKYQKCLYEVCKPMSQEMDKMGYEDTMVLVLERGALLIESFFNSPEDQICRIVAKRLDKADGTFGLGLSDLRLPKKKKFKKLHIQEDCIASGDSISGIVYTFKKMGMLFEQVRIDCPAATQFGILFIKEYLNYLGISNVKFNVGAVVYSLDEHYYLRRTKEEGYSNEDFYVGDMGEWSKILPSSLNKKAMWNERRLDYNK